MLLFVVFLEGTAAALPLGLYDAVTAAGAPRRAQAVLFLIVGGVTQVGALAGLRNWKWACVGSFLASVAALSVAFVVLLTSWFNRDCPFVLWYVLAVAVPSAGAIRFWIRCKLKVADFLPRIKTVIAIVSVGTTWAIFQFWYTSLYSPLAAPATLTVEAELTPTHLVDGFESLEATITIKNTGSSKVLILGSLYRVAGATILPGPVIPPTLNDIADQSSALIPRSVRTSADISHWDVVGYGPVLPVASWLDAGQEWKTTQVFFVPDDLYDIAQLRVGIAVAHGARIRILETPTPVFVDRNGWRAAGNTWPVQPMSMFERITRGNRSLFSGVTLQFPDSSALSDDWLGPPTLWAFIEQSNYRLGYETPADLTKWYEHISSQYGLSVLFATTHELLAREIAANATRPPSTTRNLG